MRRLLEALAPLRRDQRGAVAIMLTLSLIPLSIAGIGAVDLARALSARSQLQDALDAGALAALRASANDAGLLQSSGKAAFDQNLQVSGLAPFTVTAGPTFNYGDQGRVLADASAKVDTLLLGIFSGNSLQVAAHSEIVRSDVKLEIALVLDNTGSMATDNKIGDLIGAADNFVDTMVQAANVRADPDAVQISLVPFSNTVRLDPAAYSKANWVDQTGKSPINQGLGANGWALFDKNKSRLQLFKAIGASWAGCVESRRPDYDVQDIAPSPSDAASLVTPFFAPDEPDGSGAQNDYITDQSTGDWNTRQSDTTKYKKKFVKTALTTDHGPNAGCKLQALQPLSTNYAAIKSAISGMTPVGDTNIPMGLVWGWHTLSPKGPFTGASAYGDPKHSKIVVLMTDGFNQFTNQGGPNGTLYEGLGYVWEHRIPGLVQGDTYNTAPLNARLATLCQNMKAAKIEIYTVAVEGRTAFDTTPLRSCATDGDHFYDVTDGAGLDSAFQSIAGQIANLHLAR